MTTETLSDRVLDEDALRAALKRSAISELHIEAVLDLHQRISGYNGELSVEDPEFMVELYEDAFILGPNHIRTEAISRMKQEKGFRQYVARLYRNLDPVLSAEVDFRNGGFAYSGRD